MHTHAEVSAQPHSYVLGQPIPSSLGHGGWGVSPSTGHLWGGLGRGATRARDFVIFKNMHASACDHHFFKKCARRAARCNFFKKYPCSSLRVARARASQGGWAHRAERAVLPQIHT